MKHFAYMHGTADGALGPLTYIHNYAYFEQTVRTFNGTQVKVEDAEKYPSCITLLLDAAHVVYRGTFGYYYVFELHKGFNIEEATR